MLFRELDEEEAEKFREHARNNPPEDLKKWELYHPVCREEWIKQGLAPEGEGLRRFNKLLD